MASPCFHCLRMRICVYAMVLATEISLHVSSMSIQNVSFLYMFELTDVTSCIFPHFRQAKMTRFILYQSFQRSKSSLDIRYVNVRAVTVLFGIIKSSSSHHFRRTVLCVSWLRNIILGENVILDRRNYSLI